jgi:alanyl-tRNA synthetase
MTRKLYWSDSHLTEFRARVLQAGTRRDASGKRIVVLDETAFYPLGGGQPADKGKIGSLDVVDVQIGEDGTIDHAVDGEFSLQAGEEVECSVDPGHRREMTQQHTGQHILSQAFFRLFGAETRGFRIGDEVAEIDLALDASAQDFQSAIEQAETLANEIVFDDREILTHLLTPEEASHLPLRKENFVSDCVRVVEIADFDWSPCGGTHASRTGEVGMIVVRGFERAKRMLRIEFACGVRALDLYRSANRTTETLARRFTVGRDEVVDSVERLALESKTMARRSRELAEMASRAEARDLLEEVPLVAETRIVSRIFEERDLDDLKLLAHRLSRIRRRWSCWQLVKLVPHDLSSLGPRISTSMSVCSCAGLVSNSKVAAEAKPISLRGAGRRLTP